MTYKQLSVVGDKRFTRPMLYLLRHANFFNLHTLSRYVRTFDIEALNLPSVRTCLLDKDFSFRKHASM